MGEDGEIPFLLMVSTLEPRKNHLTLLDAWERLRARHPRLQLVCVGSLGWEHDAIVQRFEPWLRRGGVHFLSDVPSDDLRQLYRHAAATVCPSYGEGFDFAGVESMGCGGVVAASDIRVHRDVYAQACRYFDPYAVDSAVRVIGDLVAPESGAEREALRVEGARVAGLYRPERVMPAWREFLHRVVA